MPGNSLVSCGSALIRIGSYYIVGCGFSNWYLFLFAVMMLESKLNILLKNSLKYVPVGFIFSFFLLVPLFYEISNNFKISFDFNCFYLNIYQNWYDLIDATNDIEVYGQVLYCVLLCLIPRCFF